MKSIRKIVVAVLIGMSLLGAASVVTAAAHYSAAMMAY
jgi:hypothetical protein